MAPAQILNTIGLILNMFGVFILFKFGIPPEVNPHGHTFELGEQDDLNEKQKWLKYKKRSNIGLLIIFLGFLLQLIGGLSTTECSN